MYDEGYRISDAYDVTFKPSLISRLMYITMLRAKLKKSQSDESERLPIPATYVIGENGTVVWKHFDPDFKTSYSREYSSAKIR